MKKITRKLLHTENKKIKNVKLYSETLGLFLNAAFLLSYKHP